MAMETRYICTGGCGGSVSDAEFQGGKATCGTQGCPNFGKPFVKKMHCTDCGAHVDPGVAHGHEQAAAGKKAGLFSWLPWMKK